MTPPRVRRPPALPTPEDQRRYRVYRASRSDGEAAGRLGISSAAFSTWRQTRGIPPCPPPRLEGGDERENARWAAYDECATDKEAAARLGEPLTTYQTWRQRRGAPAHRNGHWRSSRTLTVEEEMRRSRAYHCRPDDASSAAMLGISENAFQLWRLRRGYPGRRPGAIPMGELPPGQLEATAEAHRIQIYHEAADDRTAARRLGLKLPTFIAWRKSRGLPSKRSLQTDAAAGVKETANPPDKHNLSAGPVKP